MMPENGSGRLQKPTKNNLGELNGHPGRPAIPSGPDGGGVGEGWERKFDQIRGSWGDPKSPKSLKSDARHATFSESRKMKGKT